MQSSTIYLTVTSPPYPEQWIGWIFVSVNGIHAGLPWRGGGGLLDCDDVSTIYYLLFYYFTIFYFLYRVSVV